MNRVISKRNLNMKIIVIICVKIITFRIIKIIYKLKYKLKLDNI